MQNGGRVFQPATCRGQECPRSCGSEIERPTLPLSQGGARPSRPAALGTRTARRRLVSPDEGRPRPEVSSKVGLGRPGQPHSARAPRVADLRFSTQRPQSTHRPTPFKRGLGRPQRKLRPTTSLQTSPSQLSISARARLSFEGSSGKASRAKKRASLSSASCSRISPDT